jgi:hypothetical protein
MKNLNVRNLRARMSRIFLILVCVALTGLPVLAQTFYGAIVGTVADNSGAVVSGANVTLTNIATDEKRTAPTDGSGDYRFVNLAPGNYRVDVEKSGFKHFRRDPITVDVQSTVRIDAALQVGDVKQTVEVTSETPLLQTETTSLGTVVESRAVEESPLNGRNVFNLVALVPGVVAQGQALSSPTGQNIFAWGNYQIGGGQANQSASYLDGGPLNVAHVNITVLVPTQDAIQEFRVQTNNLGPEFGRLAGGAVNLLSKSGSNTYHGSTYEFFRNKIFNARNFYSPSVGGYVQNQFGTNIGGPIKKDKTFFFFSYEGYRQRYGQTFTTFVPTDAERGGDFSAAGLPPIYDPLTTVQVSPGVYTRTQFDNSACPSSFGGVYKQNVICPNRVDPTANVMLSLWPEPNINTAAGNFTRNDSEGGSNDQVNFRVDQNISDRQHLFGRYTYWSNLNLAIDPYGTKVYDDRGPENLHTQQVVIGDTYSFSPNTTGDFRLSFIRFVYNRVPGTQGLDLSQFGPAWATLNDEVQYRNLPIPSVQGFNAYFSTTGAGSTIFQRDDTYAITPSITKTTGHHTIKFGADVRRYTNNYIQLQEPSGVFNFDNLFTSANPLNAGATGFGFASYLLGFGSSGNIETGIMTAGAMYYQGYYVADTYQVTKRLTINYGVRWDLPSGFSERHNRQTVWLPNAVSPLAAQTGLPVMGDLALVDSPQYPSRYGTDFYWKLFAPRLGLAYRLADKTVIRAGYGIFYLPNDLLVPSSTPANAVSTPWLGTLDASVSPDATLSNPFPNGILYPAGRNPSYQTELYGTALGSAPIPNTPIPYVGQWNLNVQRELTPSTLLEVAYAGSKGTHLGVVIQQHDQIPDSDLSQGFALLNQVTNPFYGIIQNGALAAPTVTQGQLELPFPQYTGESQAGYNRDSIYHALEVTLQKRFSGGGTLLASYTVSKLITNADTLTFWLENATPGTFFGEAQDNYNLRAERALSSYDVPQNLVVSYNLDLPFGRGKKFMSGVSGVSDKVISGWGVNGIDTFQRGFPTSVSQGFNLVQLFNAGESRPNFVSGCNPHVSGSGVSKLNGWFNTACFSATAPFTFGDVPPTLGNVRMSGVNNWDLALFKNTAITERFGLQFRAEFFNLFNRVQFGSPGQFLVVPQTFGVVSSQINNPRLIQFGLRLSY